MTDILLIQPPVRDFYLTAKRTIPYGLACIAAGLLHKGFSVDILDGLATAKSRAIELPQEMDYLREYYGRPDQTPFGLFHHYRHFGYSFEHIGRAAKRSGAFLVGISALFTPYIDEALKTAETVKNNHPQCKIVIGGHHPTLLPDSVLEHPAIDFVLRGEGEVSLPLLATTLKTGAALESIPGIAFKKPDGTIQLNEPAAMDDLDRFPLPASHLIKQNYYKRNNRGSAVINASRGCPLKCTYCAVGASSYLPYRRRNVESVIEEIETAALQYNVGFIDFEDENLSLDKKWFLKLLNLINVRLNGAGLEFRAMNGLLPTSLDDETICAMQAAGFKTLNLSLGSASQSQLARFNRPDVRRDFDRVLLLAETYGLQAVGYIIVGAPFQNAQASLSDLLFLASRRVLAGVSVFYPAPGSPDYDTCKTLNLLPADFSLLRSSALPVSHTTTRTELITLLRLGRILNFMKQLADLELTVSHASIHPVGIKPPDGRIETGRKLLAMFLNDGRIRGVTPQGEIYEHTVSTELTHDFLQGLKNIRMRGTR